MANLLNLSAIPIFMLIFVRVLSFFLTMPIFSYRTIPLPFKVGFSFFLAFMMFYSIDVSGFTFDHVYIFLFMKEIIVGAFIGLLAYIILSAVRIAGGFIDFQMGFAIANVVDPETGAQNPLIGEYFYIITLIFIVSVDAHHLLIDGIYNSYHYIPVDAFISVQDEPIAMFIIDTFNSMFLIAFQIAVPIVGCLFLVDVALGIIARTVPQLNVFVVGLPLKIFISFVVMLFFMSLYIMLVKRLLSSMLDAIRMLMNLFGGT